MNRFKSLDRGDQFLLASTLSTLLVWWLISGRHKYGVPKGAR